MTTAPAPSTLSPEEVRDWVDRFLGAWNSHDPARLTALCHEEVWWEDPFIHPSGVLHGTRALQSWLESIWRALPDLEFRVVGRPFVSVDGTTVGAAWAGTAHHTGPLDPPGFAATGAAVEMEGVDLHRLVDGRLSHVKTVTDTTAVARQIGAAPPPNSIGERGAVAVQRMLARRMRARNDGETAAAG